MPQKMFSNLNALNGSLQTHYFLYCAEIISHLESDGQISNNFNERLMMMKIIITNPLFQVSAHQCTVHRAEWCTNTVSELCSGGALFESQQDTNYPDRLSPSRQMTEEYIY
jgi:hypothetical protein